MKKIEIKIPEDMSNYIEGLMYEVNARKDLVAFCIERGVDINNDIFQRYHKEYIDFSAQYEIAKKEMENTYIKPKYPNCKWNLDFSINTVLVEVV